LQKQILNLKEELNQRNTELVKYAEWTNKL